MMTWDEFNAKFNKIADQSDPDVRKIICEEFGSWRELAFGILEMELWDAMKYSDLCHALAHDKDSAIRHGTAKYLSNKLADFKKEYSSL